MNNQNMSKEKENDEEGNAKSEHLTSKQCTLRSRESSPNSQYREPFVQIMNDSEFSSPRRGSSTQEKQEEVKLSVE